MPSIGGNASRARRAARRAAGGVLGASLSRPGIDHVLDPEVAVPCQSEIDEGRSHAGEHPPHPALVEVADQAPAPAALDEEFHQPAGLDDGYPRLERIAFNQELSVHTTWATDQARAQADQTFTNRRRSRPMIRPVAAQQKSMKEPP